MKKIFIVLFSLLAISSLLATGAMVSFEAFNNTGSQSFARAKAEWQPRELNRNGDREVLLTQDYTPSTNTAWSAGFSDVAAGANGRICYENFKDVYGSIESISFNALTLFNNGTGWEDGTEDPMTIQIKFYAEDATGAVGTMVAEFEMDLTRQATGETYNQTIPLYAYTAALATPVNLPRGWVSIQGVGTAAQNAIFAWMSSHSGQDEHSLNFDGTTWGEESLDRSLIINGTAYQANTLTGTVTLNGGSGDVEDVVVKLTNNGNYWGMANPNAAGLYTFNIPAGDYDINATRHGYIGAMHSNVAVALPFTTQDLTLDALPVVSVSGHVEGSDNPGTGLAGATVTLTGYQDYEVTTDASGDFTVADVYTNETYQLSIMAENYSAHAVDLTVNNDNVDLGTITLTEQTNPPVNVTATANAANTEATIAWSYPAALGDEWTENFDTGTDLPADWTIVDDDGDGQNWYVASVAAIGFPIGAHSGANVITSRSWNGSALTPDNYLITPQIAVGGNTHLNFWAAGLEAAYDNEHFFVKVSTSGTNAADFTDTILDVTSDSTWTQHTYNLSSYAGQDIYIAFHHNQRPDENFLALDDISITNGVPADREVLSYSAYRFLEVNAGNEDQWTLLEEDISDTTLVDTAYHSLAPGIYQWAVKAKYTGDIMSNPGFSNTIERNMYAQVTINVSLDSEDSPEGAVVTLTQTDGDRTYTATAPASGEVVIADVFKSMYSITATLPGYDDAALNNQPIFGDTETLNMELEEKRWAAYNPACTAAGYLTWEAPMPAGTEFTEGFDEGAISADWLTVDTDGDGYNWKVAEVAAGDFKLISESYVNPPGPGALTPNNYLIIPNVVVGRNSALSFDASGSDANDYAENFYVKVSTSGNNPANFTDTVLGPIVTGATVLNYSADLSDYAGQVVSVAIIHTECTNMFQLRIDNMILSDQAATRSADRHFVNYKVYLDGTFVAETDSLHYQFTNLDDGTDHTAGVAAVYSSGDEAEMVTVAFTANGVPVPNGPEAVPAFETALNSNYPNPFNPVTYINYSVKEEGPVSIEIYNLKGQKVKTLVNEANHATGNKFQTIWNGTNESAKSVSSGVYFYRMKTGRYTSTKKMILMK